MAITTGQVSVGTSEVQLMPVIAGRRQIRYGVIVKADADNGGIVYVGATGVLTTDGIELTAGESVTIPINDDSGPDQEETLLYGIATLAAQGVSFLTI